MSTVVDAPSVGRPRKLQDVEAVQSAIDGYFTQCEQEEKLPHIEGLAYALGCVRQTLLNYEQYHDAGPIVDAIQKAKQRCGVALVDLAFKPKNGLHPAIPIFFAKNNHGYVDVQKVEMSAQVAVIGVQASEEQRRGWLPTITVQPLSPPEQSLSALSPIPDSAVSDARDEAKATPIEGVSPRGVA